MVVFSFSLDQKKLDDAQKAKEIRQLQKESRKRDNKIKTLESDARRRELVLKRRQEEVRCVFWKLFCAFTSVVHV